MRDITNFFIPSSLFTHSLYQYYYHKGFYPWLVDRITKVLLVWSMTCSYVYLFYYLGYVNVGIPVSIFMFIQGVLYTGRFLSELPSMNYARSIYQQRLELSDEMLSFAKWSDITYQMVQKDIINNELLIQCSVVREDNFIMGMFENNILVGGSYMSEWYIELLSSCLRMYIKKRVENPTGIRNIFILHGVVGVILIPYLYMYRIMYLAVKHMLNIYNEPSTLMSKRWSVEGAYKFRMYNELPHEVEARMVNAGKAVEKFNALFPSLIISKIAERSSFILAEIIAVLLIILYTTSQDTLKTITAIMLAWTILQQLVIPKSNTHDPKSIIHEINTLLCIDHEHGDNYYELYVDLSRYYISRLHYGLIELLGPITAPLFLFYNAMYLDNAISIYIDNHTTYNDTIGPIFRGSEFNQVVDEDDVNVSKLVRSQLYYAREYPMSQSVNYSNMLSSRFMYD